MTFTIQQNAETFKNLWSSLTLHRRKFCKVSLGVEQYLVHSGRTLLEEVEPHILPLVQLHQQSLQSCHLKVFRLIVCILNVGFTFCIRFSSNILNFFFHLVIYIHLSLMLIYNKCL